MRENNSVVSKKKLTNILKNKIQTLNERDADSENHSLSIGLWIVSREGKKIDSALRAKGEGEGTNLSHPALTDTLHGESRMAPRCAVSKLSISITKTASAALLTSVVRAHAPRVHDAHAITRTCVDRPIFPFLAPPSLSSSLAEISTFACVKERYMRWRAAQCTG